MEDTFTVWDFLTFLWDSAMGLLNTHIGIMGLDFTLWQFALGSTILIIVARAVLHSDD